MSRPNAEQIHQASLALLEDPGVKIEHEAIAQLLLKHGALPGDAPDVLRLPRRMVQEYLQLCPGTVSLTDRFGRATVLSASGATAFWSCPGLRRLHRGEYRPVTSADLAGLARLMHRLEHVQGVFGMALADVPAPAQDVAGLNLIAHNTSKHVRVLCFSPQGARTLVEMKQVVGNHPWFSIGFTAHGPLRWTQLALEIYRCTAGHGIPASVNGEPMAGVSGPVTLAGTAAVGNAEILAGLVINQLLEPARPCIYNLGLAHVLDMRTAIAVTGGPENALLADLSAAMGRFYGLPSASWVSTEAMSPDAQAALEKMFGFHTHLSSGVSNIWGIGQLESQMTLCPAQAVIDNEMIAYAHRYRRGVEVNPQTLALDLTRAVGPGGSFLDQDHTAEHFRAELFTPDLLCRQRRPAWTASGQQSLTQRAEELADTLMSRPPEHGLSDDQSAELQRITDRFLAHTHRA